MRMATIVSVLAALSLGAGAQVLGDIAIDGVVLTAEEMAEYNAAVEAQAVALKNTTAFVENVVQWIDQTAPAVVKTQEEANRMSVMRADFIELGKRVIAALSQEDVTGPDIREKTLSREVESKDRAVATAQREFDILSGVEEMDEQTQKRLDAVQKQLDDAKTEQAAATDALDTFRTNRQQGRAEQPQGK